MAIGYIARGGAVSGVIYLICREDASLDSGHFLYLSTYLLFIVYFDWAFELSM